jgi:hypothetical protein
VTDFSFGATLVPRYMSPPTAVFPSHHVAPVVRQSGDGERDLG